MKKSVWTLFASCLMVSSVVGFSYDANIGYFPVARQSGGIYQVDARLFKAVPYGNVFGGLGLLGSNRSNSFDWWVSAAAGFQFDPIDAITLVSVKPEVSVVVNGYTNPNAALALGAVVSVPYPTSGLTGGFFRWSLNGDVMVGFNFSHPFAGSTACKMTECKKEMGQGCNHSEWSCNKSGSVATSTPVDEVPATSATTESSPSHEGALPRIVLAIKTETVSFQDIKGKKGEAAIVALTRVGLFSDAKQFFPNKKPSVTEYNAVMGRLVKGLGLSEVPAVKEVPSRAQLITELRAVLATAAKSHSTSDTPLTELPVPGNPKKKEGALTREGLALLIYEQLQLIPSLLSGN